MQEKPDHHSFVQQVLRRTGWSQTDLAKRAGLDPSTLSRFLSSTRAGQSLRASTLRRIEAVTGLSFAADPLEQSTAASGFSEAEATLLPQQPDSLTTLILQQVGGESANVDAWHLNSRALELAGHRPGDILFVKLGETPLKGDVVCAQIYDWTKNRAETVFRLFSPPYLVSATTETTLLAPYAMSDDNVVIKGVVLHSLRNRGRE